MKTVRSFLKDEEGSNAAEYGLIAALVAVALIGGATLLGSAISSEFTYISTKV